MLKLDVHPAWKPHQHQKTKEINPLTYLSTALLIKFVFAEYIDDFDYRLYLFFFLTEKTFFIGAFSAYISL